MMQFPEGFSNIPGRETLARSQVLQRTWPFVLDMCVAGIGLACFYGVVYLAKYWFGGAQPEIVISQSPRALPLYAFYSIVRIGLAYLLSLVFAIGYGYVAAYNKRIEALMIAGLDILQSIPVLSFLPGVMLAMVALFPTRQIGVEMGAIVLIFTGQVWNMAFSFYSRSRAFRGSCPKLRASINFRGCSGWCNWSFPIRRLGWCGTRWCRLRADGFF
jgi:NitT/TauT family transport system permease protein